MRLQPELATNAATHLLEQTNLADAEPDKLAEMIELARTSRVPSEVFPSPFDGA